MDKDAIKKRIESLKSKNEELERENIKKQSEIDKINIENKKHSEDINRHEKDIEKHKSEIIGLENNILDIQKRDPRKGDETMLNVYLMFALILGIGTFLMYMATFGSAQLGLLEGDSFIRSDIFSDLLDDTGKLIVSAIAPLIAIGLGFAYGKLIRERKKVLAFSCLFVVLLVDIAVGYFLSEKIYNQKYSEGLVEEPWQYSMIFTDVHFYVVIILNFGMYYGFSWFANSYFEEKEKLSPDKIIEQDILKVKNLIEANQEKIELIRLKIEEVRKLINDNLLKIEELKGEIKENEITILKNKELIIGFENGRIPINSSYLKQLISKYIEGYSSYVSAKYQTAKEKADHIMRQVQQNEEIWFREKQENWV